MKHPRRSWFFVFSFVASVALLLVSASCPEASQPRAEAGMDAEVLARIPERMKEFVEAAHSR